MKASDIMSAAVVTVPAEATVVEAAGVMLEHGISGVPAVDHEGASSASSLKAICSDAAKLAPNPISGCKARACRPRIRIRSAGSSNRTAGR